MSSVADRAGDCPECGAKVDEGDQRCWLCGHVLGAAGQGRTREASPTVGAAPVRQPFQFGLSTLMLSITLLSVCLGVFALVPGLGIVLLLVALPPFVRTALVVRQREAKRQPVSTGQRVALFGLSFMVTAVIVTVTVVASGAAFFFTCLGTVAAAGERAFPSAMGLGLFAAIIAAGLVLLAAFFLVRWRWRHDVRDR